MDFLNSLHARVLISASVLLCLFLSLLGWRLLVIYKSDTEQFYQQQLKNNLYAILSSAKESSQGEMRLPKVLPNPELNRPGSDIQAAVIGEDKAYIWLSASHQDQPQSIEFFQQQLKQLKATTIGEYIYSNNIALNTTQLLLTISWDNYAQEELYYSIRIQRSRNSIDQQINDFTHKLWLWLGSTGFVLILLQGLVLNWGLRPLRQASHEVKKIQTGEIDELSTNYPKELSGLTLNINNLINYSTIQLKRYRNGLGDLSHSLKTPLAIIQGVLDQSNSPSASKETEKTQIQEQLQYINTKVQYHLQRAAIAGNKPLAGKVNLHLLIEKITKALHKVYFDKQIQLKLLPIEQKNQQVFLFGEESDLMELLGNLLDNAFKYASSYVHITISSSDAQYIGMNIINDSQLIDESRIKCLMQRGVRADQQQEGQGIGLHIVSEIVHLYQGEIIIKNRTDAKSKPSIMVELIMPGEILG